jgi:hypothetical protein
MRAPALAKAWAVARPTPADAPVITTNGPGIVPIHVTIAASN